MSWNKPLVPWMFMEMVKGAPKCLEFTSEHLETLKLLGPLAGPEPPAFCIGPSFQVFPSKTTTP